MKKVHLIATGGSVMHNIALALHGLGYQVSGSDDQIYEPARSRLSNAGILPQKEGWDSNRISRELDAIILGMHAKSDNPELQRALELGLPIYSFPEFVGLQYQNKRQIVVIGSHGKTTTTSMLMHVFKSLDLSFDYLVGAQVEGFHTMVSFSDAPLAIIEGDEYLSSCLDARPKFMHYHPFVTIVTGVAWDHYNVFPSYESYLKAFIDRIESLEIGHHIVYYKEDKALCEILDHHGSHLVQHPYDTAQHERIGQQSCLLWDHQQFPLHIFGKHNLQNLQAVLETCSIFGLNMKAVYESLTHFKGASKRMELLSDNGRQLVYRDFAHAPSKVKATLQAIRDRYPLKRIGAVIELHTYSSLSPNFLPQYADSCQPVDQLVIYFDQKALEIKRLAPLDADLIQSAFNRHDAIVCPDLLHLNDAVSRLRSENEVLLFLGSGQFGGLDLRVVTE